MSQWALLAKFLSTLGIVEGLETCPLLTAIGHHIPGLLRNFEYHKVQRGVVYNPLNYTIHAEERTIFHAMRTATYRIKEDGDLSILFDQYVPEDEREAALAGARKALSARGPGAHPARRARPSGGALGEKAKIRKISVDTVTVVH